jgi:hypothetical protein
MSENYLEEVQESIDDIMTDDDSIDVVTDDDTIDDKYSEEAVMYNDLSDIHKSGMPRFGVKIDSIRLPSVSFVDKIDPIRLPSVSVVDKIETVDIDKSIVRSPMDNQNKKVYKKNTTNYIAVIPLNHYNLSNLTIDIPSSYRTRSVSIARNMYKYSEKELGELRIKTPFIKVTKEQIELFLNCLNEKKFTIDISQEFLLKQFLEEYDAHISKFYKRTGKHNGHVVKTYRKSSGDDQQINNDKVCNYVVGKLKSHLKEKNIANIYNYNISKKYPSVEIFEIDKLSPVIYTRLMKRFATDQKEIRYIISPQSYIDVNGKYGSSLRIISMEIKYQNAKIDSVLDKSEQSVKEEILSIQI